MTIRDDLSRSVAHTRILEHPGGEAGTLTAAQILWAFDGLRREVALEFTGRPGVFAGYDQLDMPLSAPPAPEFCAVAELVQHHPRGWHRVRYSCHAILRDNNAPHHLVPVLLARGEGITLVPEAADVRGWLE